MTSERKAALYQKANLMQSEFTENEDQAISRLFRFLETLYYSHGYYELTTSGCLISARKL